MGDGRAERAVGGALGIDVDPLAVARGVGEQVDPFLADADPLADAELLAGGRRDLVTVIQDPHVLPRRQVIRSMTTDRAAGPRRPRCRTRPRAPQPPARTAQGCRCAASAAAVLLGTVSPGLACITTPAAACTTSPGRDRPAPRRHAATPTASASSRVSTPSVGRQHVVRLARDRQRGVRVAALRPDHRLPHVHRARPRRARRPGPRRPPAAVSISRASATVSSTTSAGPPPASTSTDSAISQALPAVRPSGVDMSVSSATVLTPASVPRRDHRLGELAGLSPRPS